MTVITTTLAEFRNSRELVYKHRNADVFEDADVQSDECMVYGLGSGSHYWGYIERPVFYTCNDGDLKPITLNLLMIGNEQYLSDNLADLEEKLYLWQIDNGAFEETPSERRDRLLRITAEAMDMFWEHVADQYPECKTGDIGPAAIMDFKQSVYKVVTTWRDNNGGGQDVS